MKYVTLFIFLTILLLSVVNAQISVTASDWEAQLVIGKKITTFNDRNTKSVDIGSPGSTTWDFSGLTANDEFVTESKDFGSSPYAADFPGSEFASHYEGTFEGVFSSTWVYNTIDDFLISHGTGTVANTQAGEVKTLITFENGWTQYKLPVEYNGTWNYSGKQTIATTITLPFIGDQTTTLEQQRTADYTVDAYGTVKLPNGKVLNALRIREESHLVGEGVDVTSVLYRIITKTGELISITLAEGVTSNSGVVNIDAISWTTGDGTGIVVVDPVNAPTGLAAVAGESSITLNWVDNSDNELGFKIERSQIGSLGKTNADFSEIAEVDADVTIYEDATAEAGVEYSYRIAAFNNDTTSTYSDEINAKIEVTTDVKEIEGLPTEYALEQNYPNPFNPSTNIQFSIPQSENVILKIYNSLGQEVAELVNQNLGAGNYNFDFNASGLTSGIYFYSLRTGSFTEIKKMMLIK